MVEDLDNSYETGNMDIDESFENEHELLSQKIYNASKHSVSAERLKNGGGKTVVNNKMVTNFSHYERFKRE